MFDVATRDDARHSRARRAATAALDGLHGTLGVAGITLVAIFLDDARLAVLPPSADAGCQVVAGVIFAVFVLELLAASLLRPRYAFRLYWWCDAVATASMALEVPALVAALSGRGPPVGGASVLARGTVDTPDARARSIMRVTRILRLMRVVKLYQQWQARDDMWSGKGLGRGQRIGEGRHRRP